MASYHHKIGNPKHIINMDETSVYLNYTPNFDVHPTVLKTAAIMIRKSRLERIPVAISVAIYES